MTVRRTGLPIFALDLRQASADDPASSWLELPIPMRAIGAVAMEQQFLPCSPRQEFDAIIYIDKTHAAVQLRK